MPVDSKSVLPDALGNDGVNIDTESHHAMLYCNLSSEEHRINPKQRKNVYPDIKLYLLFTIK